MTNNSKFLPFPGCNDLLTIPEDIVQNMSTDAKLSYKLLQAIKERKLTPELQEIQCGPLCHSRWLTTGMRIIYLSTREHNLSGQDLKTLELLVNFCLKFYFKLYFDIKVKHKLQDGPYHILTAVRILRTLPKNVQDSVTLYVRSGAWFAHS